MNVLSKLALGVLRRLRRHKPLERPAVLAEDWLENLKFQANASGRAAGNRQFREARSLKDHFHFSRAYFGAYQIQTEILALLEWVAEIKPRTVCEIGTAAGGTTYLLGQSLPSVDWLIGIDLFVRRKKRLQYFSRNGQRLTFLDGGSYTPKTVDRVRELLGTVKLDVLFIDGDHTFRGVASDFAIYRHFVRDGGIIVFHDIVEDYTTRYGRSTPAWTGDVPRFWREIKPLYRTREFVESPDQDGLGVGALVYDSSVTPPSLI